MSRSRPQLPKQLDAVQFDLPSEAEWRSFAEASLKGLPWDKIRPRTVDPLQLEPFHAESPAGVEAVPGQPPYARGFAREPFNDGWQIIQRLDAVDPVEANRQMLYDLERGASRHRIQVGAAQHGLRVNSLLDMERTFQGVLLEVAPPIWCGDDDFLEQNALLLALLESLDISRQRVALGLGLDLCAHLAATGRLRDGVSAGFDRLATLSRYCSEHAPAARCVPIDSVVFHRAGASIADELSLLLASLAESARQLTQREIPIEQIARQLRLRCSTGTRMFMEIAKHRALRRLSWRVLELFGLERLPAPIPVDTEPSQRRWTRRDPSVNLLRHGAATYAAALGGATGIESPVHTSAIEDPDDEGRRTARNVSLVLQEESALARIADPAGGSHTVETLTDQICEAAWSRFQQWESQGGLLKGLQDGGVQQALSERRAQRAKAIRTRKDALLGVSVFANLSEPTPYLPQADTANEPTASPVGSASESVGTLGEFIARLKQGAQLSELSFAASQQGRSLEIDALADSNDDAEFEARRQRAEHAGDRAPQIFCVTLGPQAEHRPRRGFAEQLYASGGLHLCDAEPAPSDESEWVAAFKKSGTRCAVICAADERLDDEGPELARALAKAGAHVWIAAKLNGDRWELFRDHGARGCIHLGCDAIDAVDAIWNAAEVQA